MIIWGGLRLYMIINKHNCDRYTDRRNSNIELLRILAMVMIVMHHYSVHGFDRALCGYSPERFLLDGFWSGGKLGVNLFVLISGYYMINSKFTGKKFLKLAGQVWFYSVGIMLLFLFILTPEMQISKMDSFYCFFPLLYSQYWFATTFIWLMFLSPFLNKFLHIIDKKSLEYLIGGLMIFYSVFPTVLSVGSQLGNLGQFIVIYMVSAYIRMYVEIKNRNKKAHIICAVILFGLLQVGNMFDLKYSAANSFLVVVLAVELFLIFLSFKPMSNKWINIIGGATFGVYLIHDNRFMRSYLWTKVFRNQEMYGTGWLWLHAVIAVVSVYVVLTVIELVRQNTIEKIWMLMVQKKILPFGEEIWNNFSNKRKEIENAIKAGKGIKAIVRKRTWITCVVSLVSAIIIFLYAAFPLYEEVWISELGETEKIYKLIRYSVRWLYMLLPLLIGISLWINGVFRMLKKYGTVKFIIIFLIRVLILILYIHFLVGGGGTIVQAYLNGDVWQYVLWSIMTIGAGLIFGV